ncbi:hypothetical protein Tco_0525837 [Tanacetum coccineum]
MLTRVLRIILVIVPEHPSDTYVLTMKMEILLEPASNKLLVGDSLNLPDHRIHKDGDGDALFQLKSDSLPHAHAQTTKTYYKHQDSRIMKAQELKTKTSAQTLIYKIFLQRYQVYQGRLLASFQDDAKYEHIHDIDADEDITLVNDQDDADMFDVNNFTGDEVKANVVEEPCVPVSAASTKVSAASTITTTTIPTLRKGIVITELGTSTTTTISSQPSQAKVQDKGKGILVEELVKPKKKDLIRLDEEIALKLQAEFDEEERLAREKDEANVTLTMEIDLYVSREKYHLTPATITDMLNKKLQWRDSGIKRLLDDLRVTAAQVCVTAAKLNTASVKLVLLVKIEENILSSYYCLCSVNAAGV